MLRIQFKVKAEADHAQQLKIVGSLPELGKWNPYQGLKLERTSHSEWQSFQPIEAPQNIKFQFKLVKFNSQDSIDWQKLPNNSNRKFKAKYHSKLIITWSSAQGKVVNQSKRSYKVKGLPGALLNNLKCQKKSSIFDPYKKATQSDVYRNQYQSDKQDEDNFSFLQKKIIADPHQKINTFDIQEMYYDTSEVQMAVGQPKKQKVYLFSKDVNTQSSFFRKIQQEAEQIQDTNFKWFYYQHKFDLPKLKRVQFQMIPDHILTSCEKGNSGLYQFSETNAYYIFLDLFLATKIDVKDLKASLYLKGDQYDEVEHKIEFLEQFKFIAFDNPDRNQQFYQFLTTRKTMEQVQESDSQQANSFIHDNKQLSKVSLASVIDELHIDEFSKSTKVNTVYNICQKQAMQRILQPNSILILDCHLKQVNNNFFERLISQEVKNRMIIIIINDSCTEPIKQYISKRNIAIISGDYEKIRIKQKVYEPVRKHKEIIEMLKMKATLSKEIYGGEISINDSSIIFRNQEKPEVLSKIESEIKTLLKDRNYFRVNLKRDRIKITWWLASRIRAIRTLCRVKFLSEGKIGNFHLVSLEQDFEELKDQIKLFIQLRSTFLENVATTKVDHYSYGTKVQAKYTIIPYQPKSPNTADSNLQ